MPGLPGMLLLAGAAAVLLVIEIAHPISSEDASSDPLATVVVALLALVALAYLAVRPLWVGGGRHFLARTVLLAYFIWLSAGLAAVEVLRLLARHGFPIASTQRLPPDAAVTHALRLALLAGALLAAGCAISVLLENATRTRDDNPDTARVTSNDLGSHPEWDLLQRALPVLTAVGLGGALIVVVTTRQIGLFAQNIDTLRYQQASGLGFAALLQYELLLVACIAACSLVLSPRTRTTSSAYLLLALGALLVFRVERTPLVFTVIAAGLALVLARRAISRLVVVGALAAVIIAVFGLGVARLASAGPVEDHRAQLVRPVFDVAPELREQAYVYQIYPRLRPYLGQSALAADASSVIPGHLLSLAGIDKARLYTDISRDYSATMRELGYYSTTLPLRVGLPGELWADAGSLGLWLGMLAFGLLVGRLGRSRPTTPLLIVRRAAAAAFCVFAIITPLATLLPIALMVLAPLGVLELVWRDAR